MSKLDQLKERLADVHNLSRATSVLGWDQQVYMPPGGAEARSRQIATLARLSHNIFTADETGELLEGAAVEVKDLPFDSDDVSLVRVAQRDYTQDRKVPVDLVYEMAQHSVIANGVWVEARRDNNYALFAPYLHKTIELSRRLADALGYEDQLYDALLDQFEPGMKTAQVRAIFDSLKAELIPLVQAIAEREGRVDDSILHQPFDEAKQEQFGKMIVQAYGYDFSRGRQDRTIHPFETTFSRNDVRITTRFDPTFLNMALFGTMHESGHALYEQGVGEDLEGTPLARGASLGVHESQSRMWENVVGRSLRLWEQFYPDLQSLFSDQLGSTDVHGFYAAINKVQPSLIRVEADEVTYNLHIMLRFEMEQDLLERRITVDEAPEVWNRKMQEYLGITPPTDSLGILQDTHWSGGMMGYFSTYSLGNILSVQLWDKAVEERPEIPDEISRGEFGTLRGWLTEKVYRHGRKFEPQDLIQRATGEPLQSRSYIRYLKTKYGAIYGLSGEPVAIS